MIEELVESIQSGAPRASWLPKWSEDEVAARFQRFQLLRLKSERLAGALSWGRRRLRVAATACWEFPIYSQTFVYQELAQLIGAGFDVRFLYSKLNTREALPSQFHRLWPAKRKLVFHPAVCVAAYDHYRRRMPAKVEELIEKLGRASGMSRHELCGHYHFLQAFAFTRTVEACRPDYIHSYFFYEGTLFALFASHLLDIPRGVSCYADHMLRDYALKAVPLHLEQCDIVVATSERIKRELMDIAPHVSPDRIIVKPNAIDTARFPRSARKEPAAGTPFRLVCVSRIEPKKGVIYLVEAVRELLDRGIDVVVHVVGGVDDNAACRDYSRQVERRIEELGLGHAIRLEGRQPESEVRRLLENADLFVAPFIETDSGDKDGIPTSLLEAMSSGIPVVATDAGSIGEVVESGRDGLLAPQRNPFELANAIEILLRDPERRSRFAEHGASKVRQRFDVGVCEGRFHERLRAVTEARPARGANR